MSVVHERVPSVDHRVARGATPTHPPLVELEDAVRRHPEQIGRGGTGTCHRVATREGARVLKVLPTPGLPLRGRLRREIDRVAAVVHPGLVAIHAVEERDDRVLVLREWVEGPTLDQILAKRGALPFAEAAPLFRQVAEAIGELHRRGIAHREPKPGHVVVGTNGAKTIDAGLPSYDESYLPPEWVSLRIVTTRSDLWSLGVLFVHVLAGSPPMHGGVLPRATPEPLRALVDRMLAEDPMKRPPSVRPVLEVLAKLRGYDDIEEEVSGLVLVDDVRTPKSVPPPLPRPSAPERAIVAPERAIAEESTDAMMVPVGLASIQAEWRAGMQRTWGSVRRATRSAVSWARRRLDDLRARLRR